MKPVIRFDNVSKQFTLHRDRPRSFQELFLSTVRRTRKSTREKYWVLRDVSFEIESGEVLGIIGANGVGKSTVLKLISRIIEPTSGTIAAHGRIGALLELGAGFHPDLTGRENVYLNGSILGLSKAHMDNVFDDILEFSDMERFIDVPVKHYSSGMYMRLAFSIAIHVAPDILLVDEVLAVGDQAFQLRCLDRIHQMHRDGVTIVLVSHALDTVRDMCTRAIWLDDGRIQADGDVERVIDLYTMQIMEHDQQHMLRSEPGESKEAPAPAKDEKCDEGETSEEPASRWGSREAEIRGIQILNDEGQEQRTFQTGDPLTIRVHYQTCKPIEAPRFGLALYHSSGFHISGPNSVLGGLDIPRIEGHGYVDYCVKSLPLMAGTYLLTAAIHDHAGEHTYDHIHQQYTFRVRAGGVREEYGTFYIPATWRWSCDRAAGESA
jgi:lipopolysaccharide transport system ATP-binding protein